MTKKIVVLGGGESGYGSAVLAKQKGFEVFVSDKGAIGDKYKKAFKDNKIAYEEGVHTMEKILDAEVIIKSPGIPEKAEVIKMVRAKSIPIISEIEFAGRYATAKIISITGSNGKTTTATLTHKILKEGGVNVALAGNIGESFAYSVASSSPDWYVLELSSFQLDGCYGFKSDVAVLTNITPDHLDRYDYNMSYYVQSKFRVCQNQTNADSFIFNDLDPETKAYMSDKRFKGAYLPISTEKREVIEGGFLNSDGNIVCRYRGKEVVIDTGRIKIAGLHNYCNIMDSVLCGMVAGVDGASIIRSVETFGGVEHRMEFAGEVNGVKYINDSKATNVDSSWYALESLKTPTVWIAGGTDKGNDYSPLFDIVKDRVHTLVCMGVDNSKLVTSFKDIVPVVYDTNSLDEAFEKAREAANSGDTVLLSPCCASFDLFMNYEDRGRKFKAKVNELIK